jgi:hypothetical protein
LVVLSLRPDEQLSVNGPGCVVCDLLEAFNHARRFAIETAGTAMSDAQRAVLDRIDSLVQAMEGLDIECGNDNAVRRPAWQELRELATSGLQEFGWAGAKVTPFVEEAPGVWSRPLSEP